MYDFIQTNEQQWLELADDYLPLKAEGSIWRSSAKPPANFPSQGWKIHLTATILNAVDILTTIGPMLQESGAHFKGVATLLELKRLNCGLHYGYGQVGKFMTIYPCNDAQFKTLVPKLDAALAAYMGPAVPFDAAYGPNSMIYFRFGAFEGNQITLPDGSSTEDVRAPHAAIPEHLTHPFPETKSQGRPLNDSPLSLRFKAYSALSQRGKGGVYRALDLGLAPARLCIIKEGRVHGETDWDGRDGKWRVDHENHVLLKLADASVHVPDVFAHFEDGESSYLVMEALNGHNLQVFIIEEDALSVPACLHLACQMADTLAAIHAAGWAWRDCKPLNFILSDDGFVRPLDFEGASRHDDPDPSAWGTQGYVPPEWARDPARVDHRTQDVYALGMTIRQLLAGEISLTEGPYHVPSMRRRISWPLRELFDTMVSDLKSDRPSAELVAETLKRHVSPQQHKRARQSLGRMLRARTLAAQDNA